MIEMKEDQIEFLLSKAIDQVKTNGEIQLVSFTKQVNRIDPLVFFEAAKMLEKNRIFWSSTADDFCVVCDGKAYDIVANKSRYNETEKEWNKLLQEAIIHNPYEVAGTGLLALGGMSFDPKRERSSLWENFQPSRFTIPEFLLTKNNNTTYFTINIQVTKNDHPKQMLRACKQAEKKLFNTFIKIPQGVGIKSKEEKNPEAWKHSVRLAKEKIEKNEAKKIVLARELRLELKNKAEISAIIDKLIKTQATSYIFAFENGNDCFIGATPERLVKLEKNQLLSTCLAGTAPRGNTKEEDTRI